MIRSDMGVYSSPISCFGEELILSKCKLSICGRRNKSAAAVGWMEFYAPLGKLMTLTTENKSQHS